MTNIKRNHYKGPVRRATSLASLNRLLKEPEAVDELMWDELVKGNLTFRTHPKTGVCHQIWTDERPGTVALQQCIGYY